MTNPLAQPRSTQTWTIHSIGPSDPRLTEVVEIWGANRKTLGLFPAGAFADCAARGHLVIACGTDGKVAGYLAFRVQRRLNSAAIIHLCIASAARGTGCSDQLLEWLKRYGRAQQLAGLRLKCRRDYHAESLWQRLGFVARGDVRGRAQATSELTIWVHNFGQTDLFTDFTADEDNARLLAVIDANIFYDLHGRDGNRSFESKVLLEPWVDDAVKLCIVDELHNEINRCPNATHRVEYHQLASGYLELVSDPAQVALHEAALGVILPGTDRSDSERSDHRQLARAAAGGAEVFLTRDEELLEAGEEIEAQLGIRVRRPTELSGQLDETERATAYQPVRLSATNLTFTQLRAADVEEVAKAVQSPGQGEKLAQLMAEIRSHLARVRSTPTSEIRVVRAPDGIPLALQVRVTGECGSDTSIPLLRVVPHTLARTLARHLLLMAIQTNATEGRGRLVVNDPHIMPLVREALPELHFLAQPGGWERLTPSFLGLRTELLKTLGPGRDLSAYLTASPSHLEECLWPAKVLGESIPTYVIAIDPTWAAQLFDATLANGELFGAFARLALNRENVYYRSHRKAGLVAPARLLWYVTKDGGTTGTMAVRACSRLVDVETGPAKRLFGRYRGIGIYEWREVIKTAGGRSDGPVMVLRFADTEQFERPVPVADLRALGITSTFQSPTRITEAQFQSIYQAACPS